MMKSSIWSALMVLALIGQTVFAAEAVPMAADPEMEKRVNEISAELRCLVCQNQTIADSHAELAVDLKNQVREMVQAGRDEQEIVDYMVERYGDFVLYRPPFKMTTALLWAGPFLLLVLGLTVLLMNLRRRRKLLKNDVPLSEEELRRVQSLLARPEGENNK